MSENPEWNGYDGYDEESVCHDEVDWARWEGGKQERGGEWGDTENEEGKAEIGHGHR